jgi:hypothetical protein
MKLKMLTVMAVAGLLAAGTSFAQSGPGPGPRGQGRGYGGPPASAEERAARQAGRWGTDGWVCPRGGVCPYGLGPGGGYGRGYGQGQGYGWRRGLRNGTGPRSLDGTCPLGNVPPRRGQW